MVHFITESVHSFRDVHARGWFFRQKLKPRPKSDLNLGIGLELWQISWEVILLNLLWYSVAVISTINCRASAVVDLDESASMPYLLNIFSFNLDSRSSACSSSSNFFLRVFPYSSWRIWCFHLCWIRLDFIFLCGSSPFIFPFSLMSNSSGFWCSGSWCSALLVCWIYFHFFIFSTSLGSILGGFGWLAYPSLAWTVFSVPFF